jgi:hypothetical protein
MRRILLLLTIALALAGCAARAARHGPPGVPVESRPTPPPPPPEDTTAVVPPPNGSSPPVTEKPSGGERPNPPGTSGEKPAEKPAEPAPPVESVVSPEERRQALARIVADTTSASGAVQRCVGRKLLPDQESVFDTVKSFLAQTRTALGRDELWRAESLARKARQLATSLNCPG